jgi:hypothetical protein
MKLLNWSPRSHQMGRSIRVTKNEANNFGLCLKHSRGIKQDMALAVK